MDFLVEIVAIVFGFAAFVVLMITLLLIRRMKVGTQARAQMSSEESREIQALFRGFEELSKRLEALETILMEKAGKR